jgi:prolipoprotein diacylglyceryltransferase
MGQLLSIPMVIAGLGIIWFAGTRQRLTVNA